MNEDDSILPNPEPKTSLQESIVGKPSEQQPNSNRFETQPITKQPSSNAFEWPEDEEDSNAAKHLNPKFDRGEHLAYWALFWIATWGGTTVAGSLFGGALGLVGIMSDITAPLAGLAFGSMWAGGIGLFVFLHLGMIFWIFWWLDRPLVAVSIAGFVTGALCGLLVFSLITAPLGALGAYLSGSQFLKSGTGQKFQATIILLKNESAGRLRFTTTDLLLRMTAISILIAGWTAWINAL